MQLEDALRTFRAGTFELDAGRIELVQRAGNPPQTHIGPGYVKQQADGTLTLTCYTTAEAKDAVKSVVDQPGSGQLFGDRHYFDCRITDYNNQVWETDPVLVTGNYSLVTGAASIRAGLRRLILRLGSGRHEWSFALEFDRQKKQDWRALLGAHTLNLAKAGLTVALKAQEADGTVIVTVGSASELPLMFEDCLLQTLDFALAEDLRPAVVDCSTPEGRTVSMYAARPASSSAASFPPIQPSRLDLSANLIRLMECYLDYILSDGTVDKELWHPLSGYVALARQASRNSLDTWAVGASVAVEGIAKRVPVTAPSSSVDFGDLSKKVANFLKAESYADQTIARVRGMLAGMGAVSAKDRMYSLVPTGGVLQDDIDAWSTIRNSAIHTKNVRATDIVDEKMQAQLDLLFKVHRLMHCLVFNQIGYEGAFTDYGNHYFPTAAYPFRSIESESGESQTSSR
jgi:hypothetical protein